MKNFQPTLEHAIYALALAVAIGLRFVLLGNVPLSDVEADWALQALHITQGLKPAIGPNPAYVHLTAILFSIFGATNFLARFWPALAGTALVLTPWFLRDRLGRLPAILLAFGLAIDPGLVAMSHLAGGPMLAVSSLVLAGLAWIYGRRALAGVFAGLALLSGPSLWFGLLGLALAWMISSALAKRVGPEAAEKKEEIEHEQPASPSMPKDWRISLYWGIGTLLAVGSLLFLSPKGLPAFVTSFWEFLRGWVVSSNVLFWHPAVALPAYELLPLAFGITGAVRGILRRDMASLYLGIWALVAVVLTLIYPGRQTGDMVWGLLPLWVLAATELSRHFDFQGRNLWEVAATMVVVIAFLVFGWLNVASLTNMDLSSPLAHTREWLLVAVVFLIILSLLLAGTGWSTAVARLGGVWASVICLTLFTLGLSTGTSGMRQPLTAELWLPNPRAGRVDILLKVANQISELNRGDAAQLPLTILSLKSPSLHWLFRDWQVTDVDELAPEATPEMIITPPGNVTLSVDYRGEPLVLTETVDWDMASPAEWLTWIVYRQMPVYRDDIDLWVRSDLMLDSQGVPSTTP
jgi:hypothetical protein